MLTLYQLIKLLTILLMNNVYLMTLQMLMISTSLYITEHPIFIH